MPKERVALLMFGVMTQVAKALTAGAVVAGLPECMYRAAGWCWMSRRILHAFVAMLML